MAIPQITGTPGADSLQGTSVDEQVFGFAGDDTLRGAGGADYLQGGAGVDTLFGEDGNDTLDGTTDSDAGDLLDGGAGNDNMFSGSFADTMLGGDGDDVINGGGGADSIDGGSGNDNVSGSNGNATLVGGIGDDVLSGQNTTGNKLFQGGDGADAIFGGNGNDTIEGGTGNDSINTGTGTTIVLGGDGDDTVAGAGNDTIDGGIGNDSLFSTVGTDQLSGGDGLDTLIGGNGNDTLIGGAGDDMVYGNLGNDTIVTGEGYDQVFGGEGNDTYQINGRTFYIYEDTLSAGGNDSVIVSADWVKLPSGIENVQYVNGAKALPYWIDSLLPGEANGSHYPALLGGGTTFQYGFSSSLPAYNTFGSTDGLGFSAFNDAQKAFVRTTLDYVSSVVGLSFTLTANIDQTNTLVFANNTALAQTAGYAYYPNTSKLGSDVFINSESIGNLAPVDGEHSALVFIHEIAHAIGLKHPFEQDGTAATLLIGPENHTQWTVMSYEKSDAQYHAALSDFDLAALHYLYGPSTTLAANVAHGTGNNTYVLEATKTNFIWDGGGTDSIDGSALTQNLVLSLNPGEWSHIGTKSNLISAAGQVTVNFGTSIENATGGSGADSITGTTVANTLAGGGGNDTLSGGDGNDTLSGAAGDDRLTGGAGADSLSGGTGADVAVYSGARSAYIITGTRDAATVTGSEGVDVLTGVEQLSFSDMLFTLAAPQAGTGVGGMAYAWKGHQLLGDVTVTATAAAGGAQSTAGTGTSGSFQFDAMTVGNYGLSAARGATDSGSAISSADALAALRIAVGINPNSGTTPVKLLSPYQVLAADVNEDGKVTSADALGILRMAVKTANAPAQKWVFVQELQDLWDESGAGSSLLTRSGAFVPAASAVAHDATANLVGVLKGDVNGSWTLAGSAKVEDSVPTYFTVLAAQLQVPTDIWGV